MLIFLKWYLESSFHVDLKNWDNNWFFMQKWLRKVRVEIDAKFVMESSRSSRAARKTKQSSILEEEFSSILKSKLFLYVFLVSTEGKNEKKKTLSVF